MDQFHQMQFISFCAGLPGVSCKLMKRTNTWRIFYKPSTRYELDWAIWNHIKFMYENMKLKSLSADDVKLRVYSKYIEVF